MPDAVLRLLSAGVRFLAMAVAEAGIDPQRNARAGRSAAELFDHVDRAAIDVQLSLDAKIERFAVENIGRIDDRRRIAFDRVSGGQGAADFVGADGIDQHAFAADQIQNGQDSSRPFARSGSRSNAESSAIRCRMTAAS